MKCAIPYKHSYAASELKYCLRGIEKYINNPEIILIGDQPKYIQNVTHIFYKDRPELKWKERNIYEKLLLVKDDFIQ